MNHLRTAVGIRGLTTVTPATARRARKKKDTSEGGALDRVDRDGDNPMSRAFDAPEDEDEDEETGPAGGARCVRVAGEAFGADPPAFSDVLEGRLGDDWLLAACAAVAHARPTALLHRILRTRRGDFEVRVFDDVHRVDPDFLAEGGTDPMPHGRADVLWVALVEKAFAQACAGSYANLSLGHPGRALEALTGARAVRRTPRSAALFTELREGKRAGAAMVVRRHDGRCFAVLDAYERSGAQFAKLYDPRGTVVEVALEALCEEADALFSTVEGNV